MTLMHPHMIKLLSLSGLTLGLLAVWTGHTLGRTF